MAWLAATLLYTVVLCRMDWQKEASRAAERNRKGEGDASDALELASRSLGIRRSGGGLVGVSATNDGLGDADISGLGSESLVLSPVTSEEDLFVVGAQQDIDTQDDDDSSKI